jgi:hypothetical protein
LNYRLDAEKKWIQTMLQMREYMMIIEREKEMLVIEHHAVNPDAAVQNFVEIVEDKTIQDCEKIQLLLNSNQNAGYRSEVDSDDDEDEEVEASAQLTELSKEDFGSRLPLHPRSVYFNL